MEQANKKLNIEDVEFYRHELVSMDPTNEIDMKAKSKRERRAQAVSQNDKRSSGLDGPTQATGISSMGWKLEGSQKVQWKGSRLRDSTGNPELLSTMNQSLNNTGGPHRATINGPKGSTSVSRPFTVNDDKLPLRNGPIRTSIED